MNRDEVIRMACEADPFGYAGRLMSIALLTPKTLERFAALVAAAEREACAKACEEEADLWPGTDVKDFRLCAAAIRARKD